MLKYILLCASWINSGWYAASGDRIVRRPALRFNFIGFRITKRKL